MTKLDDVLSNVDATLDAALERLFAILRIKSISTDPAYKAECTANAEWHVADLKSIGFDASVRPTPGHPIGLSFAVAPDVAPLPPSLRNIYTELVTDLGVPQPSNGDLTPWFEQGVMLLNRVLTVRPGAPASHRGRGWEAVTERAIEALVSRGGPMAAILWGRDAQSLKPLLGQVPWVQSVHPSPLSASRGFFGSRPFSRVNGLLDAQGGAPVDWRLP